MAFYYYKMSAPLRDAWIEALESGKYKQGRAALIDHEGGMCCLAVLTTVAAEQGIPIAIQKPTKFTEGSDCLIWNGEEMMNHSYMALAEVAFMNANAPITGFFQPFVDRNDGLNGRRSLSFKEIADFIREEVEAVPVTQEGV